MWFKVAMNESYLQAVADIIKEIHSDFHKLFEQAEKIVASELPKEEGVFRKNVKMNFVFQRLNLPAFILSYNGSDEIIMLAKNAKTILSMSFGNMGYFYLEVDEEKVTKSAIRKEVDEYGICLCVK